MIAWLILKSFNEILPANEEVVVSTGSCTVVSLQGKYPSLLFHRQEQLHLYEAG
jgi:hypothetical protein